MDVMVRKEEGVCWVVSGTDFMPRASVVGTGALVSPHMARREVVQKCSGLSSGDETNAAACFGQQGNRTTPSKLGTAVSRVRGPCPDLWGSEQ